MRFPPRCNKPIFCSLLMKMSIMGQLLFLFDTEGKIKTGNCQNTSQACNPSEQIINFATFSRKLPMYVVILHSNIAKLH